MRTITLVTDFGDFYPGVMKGVILKLAQNVNIVDITHNIESQNVFQGAFILYHAFHFFGKNSIHLAIVDPGVGGFRKAIAIKTRNYIFISPDNGISYPSASKDGIEEVFEIDRSISDLVGERSKTFHGRDIFAPAAAMAAKSKFEKYFTPITKIKKLDLFKINFYKSKIKCRVAYIDKFGNLITNLRKEYIKGVKAFYLNDVKFPYVGKYSDVRIGEPLALVGSFNTLELSVREGDAAKLLGIKSGDRDITLEVEYE